MTERRCGDCTGCCTALAVGDLDPPKEMGVRCVHLVIGKGCGIYQTRPDSCRQYRCLWLDGDGSVTLRTKDRPDRIGVAFDAQVHKKHGLTVIARELRHGGLNDPRARSIIQTMGLKFLVLGQSRTAQERRVSFDCVLGGPPAAVEAFVNDAILMGAKATPAGT